MKVIKQARIVNRILNEHDSPLHGMRAATIRSIWARNYGEDIALTFLHNQSFFGSEWWWK